MALLHGFVLQRVAFGLDDTEGFTQDVRAALADAGVLHAPAGVTGPESAAGPAFGPITRPERT
jgi:hypothetical protein